MKIAQAAVELHGRQVQLSRHTETESVRAWLGARPDDKPPAIAAPAAATPASVALLSEAILASLPLPEVSPEAAAIAAVEQAAESDPLLELIRNMVEMLTGVPMKVFSPRELTQALKSAETPALPAARRTTPDFGIEYDRRTVREEAQLAQFSARGQIRTADGLLIDFSLDLTLARYEREETSTSLRAGNARRKDPLVINFGGSAAQLSGRKFKFDLDADGKTEEIALFAGGSGYLAIDLNRNGRIDNGYELFGPATDAGFAELARYDSDNNGWIDANDKVFDDLRVWTPAAEGSGSLEALAARGVGALYLGRVDTAFELRGTERRDLGAVRQSGLYLTESGSVGSLQEIDLSV